VGDTQISQAFYGFTTEKPVIYHFKITSLQSFFFELLTPLETNANTKLKVELKDEKLNNVTTLDGISANWIPMYEEYGGDWYLKGPGTKIQLENGTYTLNITADLPGSPYVLATGDVEKFDKAAIWHTLKTMPQLKKDFFHKPFYSNFMNKPAEWLAGMILFISFCITSGIITMRAVKKGQSLKDLLKRD